MSKQKLELTWIGKEKRPKLEPRILLEDPEKSYHAKHRVTEGDIFDNRLVFGDNLLALKALEQEFTGKVKCVFIDPPYNTGSAFTHYDDGLEHSIWLGLMRDRLEIIQRLLSDEGSLWITIDDNEAHYLKVICDEIFGRNNFLCDIAWEKRYSPPPDTKDFGYVHDHILVYRKSLSFRRNLLPLTEDQSGRYKNPDNDPRGPWKAMDYTCRYSADERPNLFYPIRQPNTGEEIFPKRTRVWAMSREVHEKNEREGRIWWGAKGTNSVPALKNFFSEINQGMMPMSLWKHTLAGHNQDAAKEMLGLYGHNVFSTPKPERLLQTVLHVATQPGDLVLDSFAGSGTTGAVAHKMGRRWIMVELGDHIHTHIIPRLKKVIDGEDKGGVTENTGWQGGGGFRYYYLAPSLIVNDRWGNSVINPEYNAAHLAEALCKLEGFTYAPSELPWWQHGHSSERDFIYVTTQNLSAEQLQALSDEVGSDQSLLICCAAFRGVTAAKANERWPNLTLKKIPKMVLARCEWGHDDYSLNVANLPMAKPDPVAPAAAAEAANKKSKNRKVAAANLSQGGLFGENE
ncbi:DNA methylase family protein [Bordetella bronchiseptica MBORD675]|uniref:site-specific DNA-methyltransferase n=1 Tax=Bordetella bronchiseptica TaxID=518 RepID=UPI00029041B2|nr:site-specific DNA-methyltransferase [Bordetella bronchiseptica]KDC98525.1 DNA methylase family protein [Bordetella bronchiseptica MBORD675]CCN04026.1 adenine specific dna methylase mod [Bordetella bronchiseptica Bbr77]